MKTKREIAEAMADSEAESHAEVIVSFRGRDEQGNLADYELEIVSIETDQSRNKIILNAASPR